MIAKYKGRTYHISTKLYGTRNEAGSICFGGPYGDGGIYLAGWMQVTNHGNRTVAEAIEEAHKKAEELGLQEE